MLTNLDKHNRLSSHCFRCEVDTNGVVFLELTDDFRDQLGHCFAYLGYISGDDNVYVAHTKKTLLQFMGQYDFEILSNLANGRLGQGIVRIENLPAERVYWSPAPDKPSHSAKATSLSEHLLLGFASLFGEPYGVRKEGSRLVNDLIPKKYAMMQYTGEGSRVKLGLHYENAALRFVKPGMNFSPRGLMLGGVSQQKIGGPKTSVSIAAKACRLLSDKSEVSYRRLRESCVYINLPIRQRSSGMKDGRVGPVPVILGAKGREEIVAAFYGDMMEPFDKSSERALRELEAACEEVAQSVEILSGTLTYLHNGSVLHGRSNFEPVFDDVGRAQRWIQRVFVCDRLDVFNEFHATSDRVFDIEL